MLSPDMLEAIDRLAFQISKTLHDLFGFGYDENVESYIYLETFDTIVNYTVNTQIPGTIRITQESDFIATRVQCNARLIASTTAGQVGSLVGTSSAGAVAGDMPDAPFLLTIKDGGTDRFLENEPVDAHLAYGSHGGLPGIWPKPRMFSRNSSIALQTTLLKNAAQASDQLRLTVMFIGWKIFDASSLDLTSRRA